MFRRNRKTEIRKQKAESRKQRVSGPRVLVASVMSVFCFLFSDFCFALPADDVADYLQQHGLKQLLAAHLEQRIEQAKPEDRNELILRLSNLYAELLETVTDSAKRHDLEERSRKLLEKAPAAGAE